MASPLYEALAGLHKRLSSVDLGEIATYIPELGTANPDHFAICIATMDGHVYGVGDADVEFTIQSISKPFIYGLALDDRGPEGVGEKVGVEPSGEAFNAISLEAETGRPRNPMINAGAIASAGLVSGQDSSAKRRRMVDALSRFAGRALTVDERVYESESATGHRNRAIAYLLRNAGVLGDDSDDVVDRYFMQCSVLVNCRDLALMAASLANGGEHPITHERVIERSNVERVLSVMSTCGMYDYAGSWLYGVGMPAKSGVSGGIIAVLPGQLGVGVFSPRLDGFGNSVRGVAACEALSREFGLHLLRPPVSPGGVVLMSHTLATVSSMRRRSNEEMAVLLERGTEVAVCRLQGPLAFSTSEAGIRGVSERAQDCSTVVLDWQRVPLADEAACRLFGQWTRQLVSKGVAVLFAGLRAAENWQAMIVEAVGTVDGEAPLYFFPTLDLALEWCEDRILADHSVEHRREAEMTLAQHPALRELDPPELEELRRYARKTVFSPGETIVRQGDPSDSVYFVTAGNVTVHLRLHDDRKHRIATMGAGSMFGELAMVEQEPRTADVDAETTVICHTLSVADIDRVEQATPGVRLKLLSGVARDLAGRLRRADREIAALVS